MIDRWSNPETDCVYTIVVHGTRIGPSIGSWWKRNSEQDAPFTRRLSEELAALGVPFAVWQNCGDFDMPEFEWSGTNDHMARLEAGRQLAEYLNRVQALRKQRTGKRPLFNLIGHSHGGNVILASLGFLEQPMSILAVHFLGTPFMLYADPLRLFKPGYWPARGFGPRNIYLTGDPGWTYFNFYSMPWPGTVGGAADEVKALFDFLEAKRYLRREIREYLRAVVQRPRWRRIPRQVFRHQRWSIVRDGSYAAAGIHAAASVEPPLRVVVATRLRQAFEHLSWPLRRALILPLSILIARWSARRLYSLATGLDPNWFLPGRLTVSEAPGFSVERWAAKEVVLGPDSEMLGPADATVSRPPDEEADMDERVESSPSVESWRASPLGSNSSTRPTIGRERSWRMSRRSPQNA